MARNVKTYKFKGQTDSRGNRAIFTRIAEKFFAIIEAEAKKEKRSISQHAAMILERYASKEVS